MEQLLNQDPVAMGMLGKQAIFNQVYRPLTYVVTEETAGKIIYYNLLTHEMIAVNYSELESLETRKYLIENWFLVPEEHDDQMLVDECRAVLTLMDSWPKKINVFHIYTTLDCNARCFYCFEKRMPGLNMTIQTASKVIEYMQEQTKGDPISIVWFGGEPLFNYPIIDFIAGELKKKGLQFQSSMFSNGILFDSEMVEKAKNLWNLKGVQITLDGTSEVYKRVKAYVTDVTDPFERVLQNIRSLLRVEIKVEIRLNIGLHNYRDMQDLADFLCDTLRGEEKLFVYACPLFEIIEYTDDKKQWMYEFVDDINNQLKKFFGKKEEKEFARRITNGFCMASGREAVTILPDGKVGICTNYAYEVLLGDIYSKELDVKVREDFGRRFYKEDKCRPCPMYPNCYIVNGCPVRNAKEGCDPVRVQMNIRKIKEKMKIKCRQGTFTNETGFS